ncbi:hypothetical protein [Halomonas sp. H10-9-1]|uniref:hypothetical protein n=1 Tax=Halomonas sp. H10-9-1 TaxID=2950871 RepID=UPI0032DEDA14
MLPRLLGPYSQAFPELDITVHFGSRRQMLTRFERQEDDHYVFSYPSSLPMLWPGASCATRWWRWSRWAIPWPDASASS